MKYLVEYVNSESMEEQGSKNEIYKRYGKEWKIKELGGGHGNWLLTKKSDILINNKSYRKEVLEYYGKQRLTENLANRLRDEIEKGNIPAFLN